MARKPTANRSLGVAAAVLIVSGIAYLATDHTAQHSTISANAPPFATVTAPDVTSAPRPVPLGSVPPGVPDTLFQGTTPAPQVVGPANVTGCPDAGSAGAHPTASVGIILQDANTGFSQHCYYATANTTLTVTARNMILNPTTGLAIYETFTLSAAARPSIALFNSPTLLDATPDSFPLGPLPAGSYYLDLTMLRDTSPAVLVLS